MRGAAVYDDRMKVIYADRFFLLNLLIDYLLCLLSARVCGLVLRRRRYLLAALIGAVVVSAALPQIGPERDLIKTHFKDDNISFGEEPSEGFMIAYTYPGMNRVLQAAGRVIRTEDDKGAILLIDDRFETKTYEKLFPEDYQDHIPVTTETLSTVLRDFWNRMETI